MTRRARPHEGALTQELIRIKEHLDELKLTTMSELLDAELSRVTKGESTTTQLVLRLVQAEAMARRERASERRIRESKLPERPELGTFDFDFQPDLDKAQILELATMGFVSRGEGVILAGESGTGKSHIAKALALEGCRRGYRVRYTTAADMLCELYASLADDSLEAKLKRYINPSLLVVDELGFDRLEQEDARNAALFFKVIDGRYNKNSTVLTTNIDFEQLGKYLGDPVVTTAIVDRMVHRSTVITIDGPSWRLKESKELNSKAGAKKDRPAKSTKKARTKGRSAGK